MDRVRRNRDELIEKKQGQIRCEETGMDQLRRNSDGLVKKKQG